MTIKAFPFTDTLEGARGKDSVMRSTRGKYDCGTWLQRKADCLFLLWNQYIVITCVAIGYVSLLHEKFVCTFNTF